MIRYLSYTLIVCSGSVVALVAVGRLSLLWFLLAFTLSFVGGVGQGIDRARAISRAVARARVEP